MLLSRSIILFLSFTFSGFCNTTKKSVQTFPYQLGSTKIVTERLSYTGKDSLLLVQLHSNENTANKVAVNTLKQSGGTLVSITNNGQRLLRFAYKNKTFAFDPNRIFTPGGRKETLQKNSRYTKESAEVLEGFAGFLLKLIDAPLIVSIHNNTDGAYSINSYAPGGPLSKDAALLHINVEHDSDDFFLTTHAAIFEKISAQNFNVVLQQNRTATDDGSLSIYCGKTGRQYINIEAQHGHIKEQTEMLAVLQRIIKE